MSWGMEGHYRVGVIIWMWGVLCGSSGLEGGRAKSILMLLGLEAGWWRSVVVLFGRPSSTSAHSAGVGL